MPFPISRASKSISTLLLVMLLFAASCDGEDPTATPTSRAERRPDSNADPYPRPHANARDD